MRRQRIESAYHLAVRSILRLRLMQLHLLLLDQRLLLRVFLPHDEEQILREHFSSCDLAFFGSATLNN